jgi:hypothetical protein
MVLERRGDEMNYFLFNLGCRVNGVAGINEVNARSP